MLLHGIDYNYTNRQCVCYCNFWSQGIPPGNTGELGPTENSAQAKTRPHGEVGPVENSAPHYRGELGPHCGELGPGN